MDPLTARRTWRTPEMIHGFVYFAPEHTEAYAALGLSARAGYFASRSAPMGATSAELVIATFFNFEPALRAPRDGRRLGQRHPRGVARRAARRHRRRAAPDPGPRDRRVIGRGGGRGTGPPRRRGRVRASFGQAAVRRTRIPSVARRSPPRAVARTDPPARVPRRHPHRGDDRRGDRRLRSARHPRRDRRHDPRDIAGKPRAGRTTSGTRRSSRSEPRATSTPRARSRIRAPRVVSGSKTRPMPGRSWRTPRWETRAASDSGSSAGRCPGRSPPPFRSPCRV